MSLRNGKYTKETKGDKGNMKYGHTHCVLMRLCKITIDFSYVKKIRTLFFNKSYDFIFAQKKPKMQSRHIQQVDKLKFLIHNTLRNFWRSEEISV